MHSNIQLVALFPYMHSLHTAIDNLASATTYDEATKLKEEVLRLGHRRGDQELLAALAEAYPNAVSHSARRALLWMLELRSPTHQAFRQTEAALIGKIPLPKDLQPPRLKYA